MSNWDDLRYALAAARAGSVSAAGRVLGVDASTVSRRLGALEEELGVALFLRTPEGVRPTEAGARLLEPLEQAELALRRALDAAASTDLEPKGTVRIAVVPDLAQGWMVLALRPLAARVPAVVVDLVTGTALSDVGRRAVDLALRSQRPTSGDLVVKRLREVRLVPFVSPSVLAREGHADLRRLPWLGWSEDSEWVEARWQRAHFADARIVLRSNQLGPLRAACVAGWGVALLPETTGLLDPGLVRLPLDVPAPTAPLWLVGNRTALELAHVRVVWDELSVIFADRSPEEDRLFLQALTPPTPPTDARADR